MSDLVTKLIVIPAAFASIISFLVTPLVIKFAWKLNMIDDPKTHIHPKVIHTYSVPRGGGLAIYIAVLGSVLLLTTLDKHIIAILLAGACIILVGLADDLWGLNPYLRLFLQFTIALIPIIAGIGIAFTSNPFGGIIDLSHPQIIVNLLGEERSIWILSDLFALIWIVFMMNILNMGAKGVDGQLSGTVVIAAVVIAILSLRFGQDSSQWPVTILAGITAGAYFGFLPWHIYPQKIMPSFGGATLAGLLLSVLTILSTTKVGTLVVVLGIPLVDTGYTVLRRVLSGKSPVWGDRGHLHHRLLDAGWSKKSIALFYWIATAGLGIISLYLNTSFKFYTIIGVAIFVGGLILWLTYRPKLSK